MTETNHESARQALVVMLRSCADYLSALAPGEVDAFLVGELELRLAVVAKKGKRKKKQAAKLDAERLSNITARLRSMDSRAEGEQLVRETAHTKSEVEILARHLDVAVRREDRLDDLIRRIIEATIGYRLSSAAIQGRAGSRNRSETTDLDTPQTKK